MANCSKCDKPIRLIVGAEFEEGEDLCYQCLYDAHIILRAKNYRLKAQLENRDRIIVGLQGQIAVFVKGGN